MDGIDEQQAAAFARELSELSKEQSEALQGAVYINRSRQEIAAYDQHA
jgi:hypothetical protein